MRARISSGLRATSSRRRDEPEQCLEERALPGTVWAEQSDGAAVETARDVFQRAIGPINDRHGIEQHDGCICRGRALARGNDVSGVHVFRYSFAKVVGFNT